jgi:hypothetical protein
VAWRHAWRFLGASCPVEFLGWLDFDNFHSASVFGRYAGAIAGLDSFRNLKSRTPLRPKDMTMGELVAWD